MTFSGTDNQMTRAKSVQVTSDELVVKLIDGRKVSVPLNWYPRLQAGTAEERNQYELIGSGEGVHWPSLDEDIRIEALLEGKHSGENKKSIDKWLTDRE